MQREELTQQSHSLSSSTTERLRTVLGQAPLSEECIGILKYSKGETESTALREAQIELLRTLANLCIDHGDNRSVLLQHEGPQAIIGLSQSILASKETSFSSTTITLLRTATGALLNMQLDHHQTRLALRQDPLAVETLLQMATDERIYFLGQWYSAAGSSVQDGKKKVSSGASTAAWSWRIVQDLCVNDAKEREEGSMEGEKGEDEEGDKAVESLVAVGANKVGQYLVRPLLPFIAKGSDPTARGPWDADDVSDLMESDMDVVQITTELLEACSLDSKQFRQASLSSSTSKAYQSMLDFLMQFLDRAMLPRAWSVDREENNDSLPPTPSDKESAKEIHRHFERAKAAIAKAIVLIAGEDENMATLFEAKENWFMDTLKDWMSRDVKERDDLVSTAMLAMGNLARKGERKRRTAWENVLS